MYLNNSAKEALVDISNWYDEVNSKGTVSIDDLARLKNIVDYSRAILSSDAELSEAPQRSFAFMESEGEEEKCSEHYPESELYMESYLADDDVPF